MGDLAVELPMDPPKLGMSRKSRECDISAELDTCKKMMAYLASEEGDGHDVVLILRDGTEIPAHSFILRLRSEKLRIEIDAEKAKGTSKPYPINIYEDVDQEDFTVFVRFLYLYEVSKDLTPKLRKSLVLLARNYQVVGLEDYCRSFLKENISCKNVLLFLEEAIEQNLDNTIGQIQQECLDIIMVDQTVFRGDHASFRDLTPRIMLRIVALPKLPVSEEALFLFLIKWMEYHQYDHDETEIAEILKLVRFPTMRGQFLADTVQPTGVVRMNALADFPCTPREVSSPLNVKSSQFGLFSVEFSSKDDEDRIRGKINRVAGVESRSYRLFFKGSLLPSGYSASDIGLKSDDLLDMVFLLTVCIRAPCGQSWSFEIYDNDTVGALKREFAKVIGTESNKIIFKLEGSKLDRGVTLLDRDTMAKSSIKNGAIIAFSRRDKRVFGANICGQGMGQAFASSAYCPSSTLPMNGFKTTKDSWSSAKVYWTQPQWLGFVFKEPKKVNKISFLCANNAADSPVAYQFQGSSDGQQWMNIFEVDKGPLSSSARELRTHEFENGRAYQYYRLHISQVQWARIAASAGKSVDCMTGFVAVSSLQFFEAK